MRGEPTNEVFSKSPSSLEELCITLVQHPNLPSENGKFFFFSIRYHQCREQGGCYVVLTHGQMIEQKKTTKKVCGSLGGFVYDLILLEVFASRLFLVLGVGE